MSTPTRIYKAEFLGWPDVALDWVPSEYLSEWETEQAIDSRSSIAGTEYLLVDDEWMPDGWQDYARQQWPDGITLDGKHYDEVPFFWPSTDRLYRARSSAQARVDMITRWGGKAVVVESDLHWRTVATANAERAEARKQKRIARLEAEIAKVRAS